MNTLVENEALYAACADQGSDAQVDGFVVLHDYLYRIAWAMLRGRPGDEALAADCAQQAIIKVHRNLEQCQHPAAFRSWAGQIVRRVVIDTLRQPAQRRETPLSQHEYLEPVAPAMALSATTDLYALLMEVLQHAIISDRSRRVIIGRFFTQASDEALAQHEATLSGDEVLPSHIQVTRSKNLAKLRANTALVARLRDLVDS